MRRLLRRLRYLLTRRRREDELREELALHFALKMEELEAQGRDRLHAAAASRRALGNDALVMDLARDVWLWPWLQDVSQDVRFAARVLVKDRRFTIAAVGALALGIGVNNSVFAVIDARLFREVPFAAPERLAAIRSVDGRGVEGGIALPDFRDWQRAAVSFAGLGATTQAAMNISDAGRAPARVNGAYVTAETFRVLGRRPLLGRDFADGDDRPGAARVAVIGHGLWLDRYGADPSVLGRAIKINDVPTVVIGVMPAGFSYPLIAQLWLPLSQSPAAAGPPRRDLRTVAVVGRLADGVTLTQARAEIESLAAAGAMERPDEAVRFVVGGLKDGVIRMARPMLLTMMGAVVFVLLIACANLANLLLARAAARRREIAIRASLGASRWRIVRQTLIECALLAAAGGALGLWLSHFGFRQIALAFRPLEIGAGIGEPAAVDPYWLDHSMSGPVYAFVGLLCLATTLMFGMLPAWHISATRAGDLLKDVGRTLGSARARRWTAGLMTAEIALTLVLLTGSGLLWRSFFALYTADPLMNTQGVVIAQVTLPAARYGTAESRQRFFDELSTTLRSSPEVAAATIASHGPTARGFPRNVSVAGHDAAKAAPPVVAHTWMVDETYFTTLERPVVAGRALRAADARPGQEGVVINERLAGMLFPGGRALGERIRLTGGPSSSDLPWMTIVGIAATAPSQTVGPSGYEIDLVAYAPLAFDPPRTASLAVRARASAGSIAPLVREHARTLDPDLPLFNVALLDDALALTRYPVRLVGIWFGVLALIALVIASVGLFAVTAHGVAQRKGEIGLRIALGASSAQVRRLFMRGALVQLAAGLSIGAAGALGVGRFLQGYLRDSAGRDPLTIAAVALLLCTVVVVATLVPARRATRIDPATALRSE